jgi:predicted dehydrogenase
VPQAWAIVLVGVAGLELQRADFYEKELRFQVSCSYGPGRYDPAYEEQGHDYPPGFVRWTAGRNFEAFLDLVADDKLRLEALVTHRYALGDAARAYDTLSGDTSALGIALTYPSPKELPEDRLVIRQVTRTKAKATRGQPRVAVIGAGNYTQQVLLPALAETAAVLDTIVSQGGATAAQAAAKHGFGRSSTDARGVSRGRLGRCCLHNDPHDSHAALTMHALRAGKHVYVEKPLAITLGQLDRIETTYTVLKRAGEAPILMVGFNRRYSPLTLKARGLLAGRQKPIALNVLVNAGPIPADHWVQDPDVGGGRIVGEACHFVDLARHLVGSPIATARAVYLDTPTRDSATLSLSFDDGSIASIQYLATGSKRFPKERVEVFSEGKVYVISNFRALEIRGRGRVDRLRLRSQDKGHRQGVQVFLRSVSHADARIETTDLMRSSRVACGLAASAAAS